MLVVLHQPMGAHGSTCTAPMPTPRAPQPHPTCTPASPAHVTSSHTLSGPVRALGYPHTPSNGLPTGMCMVHLVGYWPMHRCQGNLAPQTKRGRAAGHTRPVATCWAPLATVRAVWGAPVAAHHPK